MEWYSGREVEGEGWEGCGGEEGFVSGWIDYETYF